MSHTLHRSGTEESLKNDFPILTIGARGFNRDGCAAEQVKIGEIFLKHNAVNAGMLGMVGMLTEDRLEEAARTVSGTEGSRFGPVHRRVRPVRHGT